MNKLIQLILISIILAGCQKDEAISPFVWPYWGEASALKNGVIWKPKVIALQDELNPLYFGINFDLYNNADIWRNALTIWGIKKGDIGVFKISSDSIPEYISCFYTTILEDGDVLGDVFKLDKTKENTVEITEISGNEITGKFNVTLIRDISRPNYLESSDTLRFTDGVFHTRIIKPR
jgi:hypothetical protein